MSHYSKLATKITDAQCLCLALKDLGWGPDKVEVGKDLPLYGYQGDQRPERADIVIRRKHIPGVPNDVGFKRQADGTFEAIVSEYDQRSGFNWESKRTPLLQRYAYWVARKHLQAQGFQISGEKMLSDGTFAFQFRRAVAQ